MRECIEEDSECWTRKLQECTEEIDRERRRENWQQVAWLQQKQAYVRNRLRDFPGAIAILCRKSSPGERQDELPTCENDSAIANGRGFPLEEMMAWGLLADSYRLNRNDERAILAVEKFEALESEVCDRTECPLDLQNQLLEIAAFAYTSRGERYEQRGRLYGEEKPVLALEYVDDELLKLKEEFPRSQILFDRDFSQETLKRELDRRYKILHFATHARFGSVADETFLITGAKKPTTQNNEILSLRELETILKNQEIKPQLLVLSACETAKGDDRLTLGLGGIALRAGVPTTVASLWLVNDAATKQLISNFYANLKENQDRERGVAYALQQAQITQIQDPDKNHPYYWAAFVAIGN
ncbi:MAG: CHAT domain-containing protein [Cyanobacteria bacterium P01_E01_bin.42]